VAAAIAAVLPPGMAGAAAERDGLPPALASYPWVPDGAGGGAVYVLFEPSCVFAKAMYQATRPFVGACEFRWIAVPNRGDPASEGAAMRLLSSRSPDDLAVVMGGDPAAFAPLAPYWRDAEAADHWTAAARRALVGMVERATGRAFGSPTFVLVDRAEAVRVVRGAVRREVLEAMAAQAS